MYHLKTNIARSPVKLAFRFLSNFGYCAQTMSFYSFFCTLLVTFPVHVRSKIVFEHSSMFTALIPPLYDSGDTFPISGSKSTVSRRSRVVSFNLRSSFTLQRVRFRTSLIFSKVVSCFKTKRVTALLLTVARTWWYSFVNGRGSPGKRVRPAIGFVRDTRSSDVERSSIGGTRRHRECDVTAFQQ